MSHTLRAGGAITTTTNHATEALRASVHSISQPSVMRARVIASFTHPNPPFSHGGGGGWVKEAVT